MRLIKNHWKFIGRQFSVAKAERQGFGSFHSEDIETLIRKDTESYQSPEIYESIQQSTDIFINTLLSNGKFELGKPLMSSLYSLDPSWTFINHGAFGATCVVGQRESEVWRQLCDSQPLRYYDRIMLPMVAHVVRVVAKYFSCCPTQIMPLPNVTAGLNAVATSVLLQPGDQVICLSISYGSTKKILRHACTKSGAELVIVPLPLPIQSTDELVRTIGSYANSQTKLVVLDSITSNTALTLPIFDIATVCRTRVGRECLIVVDGAHSMFSEEINLTPTSIVPANSSNGIADSVVPTTPSSALADVIDVYLTNGHKWLSCPKGCAFMWLSPRVSQFCPPIISHGFVAKTSRDMSGKVHELPVSHPDKLLSAFSWDGCRDYSALLSVPSVIRMWSAVDEVLTVEHDDSRRSKSNTTRRPSRLYMKALLADAVELLSKAWRIEGNRFPGPLDLRSPSPMALVPLPSIRGVDSSKDMTDAQAFQLQEYLHYKHKIEVPIKCLEGALYVRISAHVYNELEDYQKLASVISKLST